MSSLARRWLWLPLLAGLWPAASGGAPPTLLGAPGEDGPLRDPDIAETAVLSSLQRKLHHFDFEEAEKAPYTMPFNFYRYVAPDLGFPRFGRMELSREVARSGRWSFMFELDGGSLAARVPTAVLSVMPGSDYSVTAWVRTDGLRRARARVVAELYDDHGEPIGASRVTSPLLDTGSRWQPVTIDVYGEYDDAADIVVELQVLQPQQLDRDAAVPQLDDVSGRAYFDDVVVWQRPRIELTTDVIGNVFVDDPAPTVKVLIRDPTNDTLTARLRVHDLDDAVVRATNHVLPRGEWTHEIDLAGLDSGWYRVVAEVVGDAGVVGRRSMAAIVQRGAGGGTVDTRFGVVLPAETTIEAAATTRQLVGHLGVGAALLPLIDEADALRPQIERDIARNTGDLLLRRNMTLTIAVPGLARALATSPGLDVVGARDALRRQPGMTDLLMRFGLDVSRWLLVPGTTDTRVAGSTGSAVLIPDAELNRQVALLGRALADFVIDPVILVPWSAEYALGALPEPHGWWITIPTYIAPEMIPSYAERWPVGTRPVYTTIEQLAGHYSPRDRVEDVLLRALHGWRAGLTHMAITPPWGPTGARGALQADAVFAAWGSLARRLDGRRFAGEIPLGEGLHGWLVTGPGDGMGNGAGLLAWSDRPDRTPVTVSMRLGRGDVAAIDAFGNRRDVPLAGGTHTFDVGRRPVFIEGVDEKLARFRAGFRLVPDALTAQHQVHEGEVVLVNPWSDTVSGTLRLRPPAGLRVTPRIHQFRVAPGGELRLPVNLVFNQRMLTGPTRVEAEAELRADREYTLALATPLSIGMPGLEFAAHWRRATDNIDDLLIVQSITNTGDTSVNLNAYVSAPGMSQQRRPISGLQPSQTAVRTFRLPGGAATLGGRRIRVGVIADDGARLNRILELPGGAVATGK